MDAAIRRQVSGRQGPRGGEGPRIASQDSVVSFEGGGSEGRVGEGAVAAARDEEGEAAARDKEGATTTAQNEGGEAAAWDEGGAAAVAQEEGGAAVARE